MYLNNKIAEYLNSLIKPLGGFLNKVLPAIHENKWWENLVLNNLNDFEYYKVQNHSVGDFTRFDIASLLKILKNNWSSLSRYYNSYNLNNFTYFGIFSDVNKECCKRMIDLRNKWAHQDLDYNKANEYINILLRFSKFIEAKDITIKKLEIESKNKIKSINVNRDELINFMEEKVLKPAENNTNTTKEILRKINHTRKQFRELETAEDIENFFWHLMQSDRGFDSHKKFKECGLTTFEDVREDFAILCGRKL